MVLDRKKLILSDNLFEETNFSIFFFILFISLDKLLQAEIYKYRFTLPSLEKYNFLLSNFTFLLIKI